MSDNKQSMDVFGVQPIADSVKIALQGVGTFLGKICLPAAEEFGLLLRDRVSLWRAKNFAAIAGKAEAILESQGGVDDRHAPPRLVHSVMSEGSWSEEDVIQDMWAGLLASACTQGERDDGNIIFTDLLSKMTISQAKMLNYTCESSTKWIASNELIISEEIAMDLDLLVEISGIGDIYRLDRELDHLRALDLIHGGFSTPRYDDPEFRKQQELTYERREKALAEGKEDEVESKPFLYEVEPDDRGMLRAKVAPSFIGLSLYVRSHGFQGSPREFFGL